MWSREDLYYRYSDFLKLKYGQKVYKLPLHIPVTCPNRDGNLSTNGCVFCGEDGAGHEFNGDKANLLLQIEQLKQLMARKYHAQKYILYFQSFSATYLSLDLAMNLFCQGIKSDIVALYISTRPDCINDKLLERLQRIKRDYAVDVVLELGLQTINYKTLQKINRGHGLAEFIDAVIRSKPYGIEICAHFILDFPWDNLEDVKEGAKIISALGVSQVKLHALYVIKGTMLEKWLEKGECALGSKENYIERVAAFLSYLNPDIAVQRLIGRAPEKVADANWGSSWWKIQDEILAYMEEKNLKQGIYFDYLNGAALKGKDGCI